MDTRSDALARTLVGGCLRFRAGMGRLRQQHQPDRRRQHAGLRRRGPGLLCGQRCNGGGCCVGGVCRGAERRAWAAPAPPGRARTEPVRTPRARRAARWRSRAAPATGGADIVHRVGRDLRRGTCNACGASGQGCCGGNGANSCSTGFSCQGRRRRRRGRRADLPGLRRAQRACCAAQCLQRRARLREPARQRRAHLPELRRRRRHLLRGRGLPAGAAPAWAR